MTAPPLSWRIGDATVTRIVESTFDGGLDAFLPFATPDALLAIDWLRPHWITPEGVMCFSIHALVIEADGLRILVDTCVGNEKDRPAFPGWHQQQFGFLEDLAQAGFPRETIDRVLCTHLHVDHVGWNTMKVGDRWMPTFPNARYLIAREEMEARQAPPDPNAIDMGLGPTDAAMMADSVMPVFEAGLVDLVDTDHRVSRSIRLVPTPGHTAGHVSVAIESAGETALITGDFIHHPCQLAHPEWSLVNDHDPAQSARTRETRFAEIADRPVLMIGTHWPGPSAGQVMRSGRSYRLR